MGILITLKQFFITYNRGEISQQEFTDYLRKENKLLPENEDYLLDTLIEEYEKLYGINLGQFVLSIGDMNILI